MIFFSVNVTKMLDHLRMAKGISQGISQGILQGIEEINALYHCLLADNRMEDIQKAIMDTDYQKELLQEYGIGE